MTLHLDADKGLLQPADHEYAAAALLPDGSLLITGGQLPGGDGEVVSEIYTPATSTFSAAGNMVTQRHEHTATLLGDGSTQRRSQNVPKEV